MPFVSQKQRAYMYARQPEIAKRWRKESGPQRGLPERAGRAGGSSKASAQRERLIRQFIQKGRHGTARAARHR